MAGSLTLVLGGARSGKSRYAEELASGQGGPVLYVATAEPLDEEMRRRIARHRGERPRSWRTLEAPREVGAKVDPAAPGAGVVLIECITMLVSNVLLAARTPEDGECAVEAEIDGILQARGSTRAEWIVVSNEVGLGVVPGSRLGRGFRDALGRANQRLASEADRVVMMVAGLPWTIRGA